MNFNVKTKELVAALQRVASVTLSSTVTIAAKGKMLRVGAIGKTSSLTIKVPATVKAEGAFSIENAMFAQSIKTRAEVDVLVKDNMVHIKGKSLSFKLVTVPDEELLNLTKKEGQEISAEVHHAFAAAVDRVSISNIHDQNPIAYRVDLTKRGLQVTAADAHHMASVLNTNVKSKVATHFILNAQTFGTINTLAAKQPFAIQFTEAEVFAWSPTFELRTATLAEEGGPDAEAISSMIASVREAKATIKATVSGKELLSVTESMSGIFEKDASVQLVSTDKGLELRFNTSYGESKGLLKTENTKGKFGHQIDLMLIRDTLALQRDDKLDLQVVNNNSLVVLEDIDGVQATYVVVLVEG